MQGMLESLFLTFFMTSLHWFVDLTARPPMIWTIRSFPTTRVFF
ncbi:MAG: hypothetical protein ACOZHQ_04390 [Thermodesulfobacteriota bacterium]